MRYDAFISYSHSTDRHLAPSLQKALHKIAKPTFKLRALNVFRDETNLSISPQLWNNIVNALSASKYFILLASPEAAKSIWVQKEVDWWLTNKSVDTILICLTDGEFIWNDNPQKIVNSSIPNDLIAQLREEPKFADFRQVKRSQDVSLKNPIFKEQASLLAAAIHEKPLIDLISDDVKQLKSTRNLRNFAICLLLAAFSLSIYMGLSEREARKNAERNYANGLAYKSRRFIQEKRFGAATVLLTEAKSLTKTSEVFATSLQLPTSLVLSDTTYSLPFNSWKSLKSNETGDAIVGAENTRELIYYKFDNDSVLKVTDLRYPRLKSSFFKNKEFWAVNDSGVGIKIDSNNIKHNMFTLPKRDYYDLDVRFFKWLPDKDIMFLALHNGDVYTIKNNELEPLDLIKPGDSAALEDVAIDQVNQRLIISWAGGKIALYSLNNWELEKIIDVNNWIGDVNLSMYHPHILVDKNTMLVTSDGGQKSLLFALSLNNYTSDPISIPVTENSSIDFENNLVKLNPVKNQVAVASNTSIITYSTENGNFVSAVNTNKKITDFRYTADGKYIIAPFSSNHLGIFDADTGEIVELVDGFPEAITGISLSDNISLVVSMEKGLIRSFHFFKIPDYYMFDNTIKLISQASTINSKGNLIAMPIPFMLIPESGQQIMILDAYTGKLVHLIEDSAMPNSKNVIHKLIFSQNDDLLLAYSKLGVAIWDMKEEPKLILPWEPLNLSNVDYIYMNPLDEINFSCVIRGEEKRVVHFEVKDNKLIKKGTKPFSNHIDLVLSAYSKSYDVPEQLQTSLKEIISFKYNSNGSVSFYGRDKLFIWDFKNGDFNTVSFDSDIYFNFKKFDVSLDGKYLAYMTPKSVDDINIYVCEIQSGRTFTITNPNTSIYKNKYHNGLGLLDIGFSEDGQSIFTLSQKNVIQHWGLFSPFSIENATRLTGLKMDGTNVILDIN